MHASEIIRPSARTERSRSEERKREGEIVVLRKKTITLILLTLNLRKTVNENLLKKINDLSP